jgi:hypothetical protein
MSEDEVSIVLYLFERGANHQKVLAWAVQKGVLHIVQQLMPHKTRSTRRMQMLARQNRQIEVESFLRQLK